MRHVLLTRSAYGPAWDLEANRRRLEMSRGVTIRSLRSQDAPCEWLVLLHRGDQLLGERQAAFAQAGAKFLYLDEGVTGTPQSVAWLAYGADWAGAIGSRDDIVAMTRLDDDDAFAPWVVGRIQRAVVNIKRRTILMLPMGIRAWAGGYDLVRHETNAMHTLVTLPGDTATVYDYGHRDCRKVGPVRMIDYRPAWLWGRHQDTISGWRMAARPITPDIREMFDVDWSLFGPPLVLSRTYVAGSRVFR